jgi:hypothetical protein
MAIHNHEHEQLIETFKKFSDLYRSKVELTGEKLRKINNFSVPINPFEPITYQEINEVSIKMPQDDFERFMKDFGNCVDMLHLARHNRMIGDQLNQLLMLVELYK